MFKQYRLRDYNFRLAAYVFAITIIGILLIGSAKESVQTKQIFGMVLGIVCLITVSLFDYTWVLKFKWPMYLFNLVLLGAVLLIGSIAGGAQRWVEIAGVRFQPSELTKIIVILFFAKFFEDHREHLNTVQTLGITLVLFGVPAFCVFEQPDLSTTICIVAIFGVLLFVSGLSYKLIGGCLALAVPAAIIFMNLVLDPNQTLIPEDKLYQLNRILAWLNPSKYADLAYQQTYSIMAIGSGGLSGKGLNNTSITSVKNANFIAEPQTDFIFAVAGEELGFIGCATIIVLLLLIVVECIMVGRKAKDFSGTLICCGVGAWIGFQSFINIGVTTGLLPNTGIPLPFLSYGVTSLVSLYIAVGFVLNVSLQPKKY